MGMFCGVGTSNHRNSKVAGHEAVTKAIEGLQGKPAHLIILHASVGYDQEKVVAAAYDAAGGANLTGCSAEGIIFGDVTDESPFTVGALAIHDSERFFACGFTPDIDVDAEACSFQVIEESHRACEGKDATALLIYPDGIHINTTKFLAGIKRGQELHANVPILGGSAGDDWRMEICYQYLNGHAYSKGVSWVSIVGGEKPVWAMSHGCTALGAESIITRSETNKIFEIDHVSVIDYLDRYTAGTGVDWKNETINIAIAYESPKAFNDVDPDYQLQITHVVTSEENRSKGYIVVQPEFPVGKKIQFARRDPIVIRDGLNKLSQDLLRKLDGREPSLILHFDCAGRGRVVFSEAQRTNNLLALKEKISEKVSWAGFFTYGEFMPIGHTPACHNYTAVLVAFP